MKPLYDASVIRIEVTNACTFKCAHCTKAVPHISKPFFADIAMIENALKSLKGWKKNVGCTGGEPTIHPKFLEICELYRAYFPREQCGLWTSNAENLNKYKDEIASTFDILLFDDHSVTTEHHPLMLASEEIVQDEPYRNELIDNCWIQRQWGPTITPKGAFFCEVAATFDTLFDGPGGYPLDAGWWNKTTEIFRDQRDRYCRFCSIPIPVETVPNNFPYDYVSRGNAKRLLKAGSPLAKGGGIHILDEKWYGNKPKSLSNSLGNDPWKYSGTKRIKHGGNDDNTQSESYFLPVIDSFSVILIGRNTIENRGKDVIIRTLKSIENSIQFFEDNYPNADKISYEIVFVDDGSTDDTLDIVKDFAKGKDYYWLVRHPINYGPGMARNTGVRNSRGRVLFFCDDDDLFLSQHISICLQTLNTDVPSAYQRSDKYPGNYLGSVQTGVKIQESIHSSWKQAIENSVVINLCVRRDVHDFIGGFPEEDIIRRRGGFEDAMYNSCIQRFITYAEIGHESVEHIVYPGNSFDRQLEKFKAAPGEYKEKEELSMENMSLHKISQEILNERIRGIEKKIAKRENW